MIPPIQCHRFKSRTVNGLIVSIGLFVITGPGLSLPAASAVPLATTSVGVDAGRFSGDNKTSAGPAPIGMNLALDKSGSFSTPYGTAEWSAQSSALTNFGDGVVSFGAVDATATVFSRDYGASASASAGGSVRVAFTLAQIASLPPTTGLPTIAFTANGHGKVTADGDGSGWFDVSAALVGVQGTSFHIYKQGAGAQDSFNAGVTVSLSPGDYSVLIAATALAGAFSYPGTTSHSTAEAYADPMVAFDQAAFDSLMGANTFLLSDYYKLSFSPNISPVPEPEIYAMLLAGLGLLGFIARRPKQQAA